MAIFAFTNGYVTINSVDMTSVTKKITIQTSAAELETTAMGSSYTSRIGGLKDWSVSLEFNQDFVASGSGSVDATMFPLLGSTTTVVINPNGSSTTTTNPKYTGSILISDYKPLDGSVGDLATTSFSANGAGTLTRATS